MKSKPFNLDLQMFAEDQKPNGEEQNYDSPEKNLLEAYQQLKEKSVPKEDYDKVLEMNKKLLDASLNGVGEQTEGEEKPSDPSIDDLRAELYGPKRKELTDLEYWEKTLALRKAVMDQGKTDPMVPVGKDVSPTQADFATAENICSVVEECINLANGDSQEFTRQLDKRVIGGLPKKK